MIRKSTCRVLGGRSPGISWGNTSPCMIVSERERRTNNMTWVSAWERMGYASTQTGVVVSVTDGRGEPPERDKVILETAPAPWDSACEVRECARSVLCKPSKRGSLLDVLMASGELASKHSVPDTLPVCKRLKGKETKELNEFEKNIFPWEPMYEAQCAARHEWYSRDMRPELKRLRDRRTAHVRGKSGHSKARQVGHLRVTSAGIPQHEWRVCQTWSFMWEIAQKSVQGFNSIGRRRVRCQPPPGGARLTEPCHE